MTAAGQSFASIGGFKVPTDDRRPLETPRGFNDPAKAMATLDTVTPEPLPKKHWMFSHPRVRVTAHVSWSSPHAWNRMLECFADNLARFAAGAPLAGVVDADEGY